MRVTKDSDLLVPDGSEANAAVVRFLKRLAGRPQDRLDLSELEAIHGELPLEPIPGLDS